MSEPTSNNGQGQSGTARKRGRPKGSGLQWTADKLNKAKALALSGLTTAAIAERMGVTRRALAGAAHWHGISFRASRKEAGLQEPRKVENLADRVRRHSRPDPATGCINWGGYIDRQGYGRTGRILAHRASYICSVGPIPDGLVLDHLCRNTACINPAHLEPVSNTENILRGVGFAAVNARKTVCVNGHAFTPENTRTDKRGRRSCIECNRRSVAEYTRRKRSLDAIDWLKGKGA